jgi:hypothetical protein
MHPFRTVDVTRHGGSVWESKSRIDFTSPTLSTALLPLKKDLVPSGATSSRPTREPRVSTKDPMPLPNQGHRPNRESQNIRFEGPFITFNVILR